MAALRLLFLICSSFASLFTHIISPHFNRNSFPEGFVFGAASSAYQYEGAAFEGGKGPNRIANRSNGDVADNFYNLYKEDVKLMKHIGLDAFRMSISWPRILPRITPFVTLFHWDLPQPLEDEYLGFLSPHIVDDFKDFAELCFKEFGDRIKHWATINEPFIFASGGYDGGLTGNIAPGRCSNRAVCVQGNSATEPYIVAHHMLLAHAVAAKLYKEKYQELRLDHKDQQICRKGKLHLARLMESPPQPSSVSNESRAIIALKFCEKSTMSRAKLEPPVDFYKLIARLEASSKWHSVDRAHRNSSSTAQQNIIVPSVKIRCGTQRPDRLTTTKPIQKGEIGIVLVTNWMVPYSSGELDVKAAERGLDFIYGWFMNPLVYGEYPKIMQFLVGNRLPNFTKEQAAMVKGSFDYVGLNYYTGNYAAHIFCCIENISSTTDSMVRFSTEIDDVPIGKPTAIPYFFVYPKGLDLLVYTKERYNNPTIYITETGISDGNNDTIKYAIEDLQRIDFYDSHIRAVHQAIKKGVNVKGFFAWSLLDTFEWSYGYNQRFGICYVDFKNKLKRIPKDSAIWFKNFLNGK
ncbi:UNVERIFIED_CONTAM: Beta-glucosidase 12 [Sesamum calycinum]|uniref:Beta-glucosidase 12 n=1 Tax=Sesamum calycinum TaxID=2727403 RepID=A0AAW2NU34_9LAMI